MADFTKIFELDSRRLRQTVMASLPLKVVYFNVPKSGSTTVKGGLWEASGGTRHLNRRQRDLSLPYSFRFEPEDLRALGPDPFAFSVVRNPFARMHSTFNAKFVKSIKDREERGLGPLKAVSKMLRHAKGEFGFKDFLTSVRDTPDHERDPHWRSLTYQTNFHYIVLDFVGALEDFDAVQNKISAIVGRPVSFRYKNNRSSGDNLMSAYDPAAIALVKEIYAEDFDNFGYSTDIADALLPPRHGANLTKAD
jgi:hypothetical protein